MTLEENSAGDAHVAAAIVSMQADGMSSVDIGHALISHGLSHFRATMCDGHVVEELEFVRWWIVETIQKTRAGLN